MRRRVYLAGPVEMVDDAKSWRDEIVEKLDILTAINPLDKDFHPVEDRYELFHWCLRQVQLADFVLVNYISGAETYGTPAEVMYAYMNGVPVVTWSNEPVEEMPQFLVAMSDKISDDLDELLVYGWNFNAY